MFNVWSRKNVNDLFKNWFNKLSFNLKTQQHKQKGPKVYRY